MNIVKRLILATTLLAATTSAAQAFDGYRRGWQVGLGVGVHSAQIEYTTEFAPNNVESQTKLAAGFQLGYGFSNRITGFIGGSGGSILVDGQPATLTIAGFGGTYYLNDSHPSLYVTGLFGRGSLVGADEEIELADSGTGWMAGIGYEVTHRLHLEITHARAEMKDPNNFDNNTLMQSSFLTAKYVWY